MPRNGRDRSTYQAALDQIGVRVREHRGAQGLGIRELARLADVGHPNIMRIEAGESDPQIMTLMTIASALNVPLINLLSLSLR